VSLTLLCALALGARARLERASSFGIFGSGSPVGGGPSRDDSDAHTFTGADRRLGI
jgi:hypothetical protein